MRKWIAVFFIMLILAGSSCVYHNTEDLIKNPGSTNTTCYNDTVTYNSQIKTFFDNKCTGCHSQGGTYPALDNFTGAHNYAITPGNLLHTKVSTNHKGTNASDCEIAHIQKWVDSGANQ